MTKHHNVTNIEIMTQTNHKIDTNKVINDEQLLVNIYSKRLLFLENKWFELMNEQKNLSTEEIMSNEFQSKRKRIGGLYQEVKKIVDAPRKKAVNDMLMSVKQSFHLLPSNTKTLITIN